MTNEDQPHELEQRPQGHREWSGYLRSLVLPLGLVVLIVGGLLYYQSRGGSTKEEAGFGTVALPAERNATGKAPASDEGRAAPDFVLKGPNGAALRLSDLQGKPTLLNFWATWCIACRQETPSLIETYDDLHDKGLQLVGVDVRESDARVQSFVDEYGLPFPVVTDRSGEVSRTWRIGGPTEGLPSSYFIDSKGIVQKVVYGTLTAKALSDGLGLIMSSAN